MSVGRAAVASEPIARARNNPVPKTTTVAAGARVIIPAADAVTVIDPR